MPRMAVTYDAEGFGPDLIVRKFDEGVPSKGDTIRLQSDDGAEWRLVRILNVLDRLDTRARKLERVLIVGDAAP